MSEENKTRKEIIEYVVEKYQNAVVNAQSAPNEKSCSFWEGVQTACLETMTFLHGSDHNKAIEILEGNPYDA